MTSQISVEVVHDPSDRPVHTTSGVERFVGRNHSPRRLGIKAFHKGLSVGLLRKATYTTARLGSFKVLTNKVVAANDGKPLPLYEKALCGVIAGAIGATVDSPPDSSLIRMQANATLPAVRCQNYKNAFHALYCCK
uniref:Mitochondrial dicarboxylate/tricarboxylate transporter DTC n=1 Tax=Vitis vinifera TaxID=29760 RepID=F6HJP4_VITVI